MTIDDPFSDLLDEFLNGLTPEEYAALSDETRGRLERLAQLAYVGAEERLNEFRAAHPEFRDRVDES